MPSRPPPLSRPLRVRRTDTPSPAAHEELLAVVIRARLGDHVAQSELVRRYTARLTAFVRPVILQPSALEDVVQTIFIKVVRRLHLLRDPANFEPWLFRLAHHTALDFIRRRRARPQTVADLETVANFPESTNRLAAADVAEALTLALRDVPLIDHHLITRLMEGWSYRDLAAHHGLSIGAVKLRLYRLRPFLRATVGAATGRRCSSAKQFTPPPRICAAA